MKKFKIYGFANSNPVLITDSDNLSSAATFDENMVLQENMKSTLNFKISDTLDNGEANPFMGLVYPGARLRIKLENNTVFSTYDFIIKSLESEFYKDLIVYSASAEDYASTIYSKEGQGLSFEYTGTLKEIIYEILLRTRKNLGYRGLNKNYLNFKTYNIANGIVKDFSATFNTTTGTITFPRGKDFAATEYTFSANVLQVPSTSVSVSVTQLDANGTFISSTVPAVVLTAPGLVDINFTAKAGMAYYRINFIRSGTGPTVVSDFKLNLKITSAIQSVINESLKLSTNFNEVDFKGELGDTSYFKKVTISLENSNLYNALFEAAKLFNAEVAFDYENNSVNFINKDKFTFKGYRLSPTFNLLSLSRTENFDEFNSAMNVTSEKVGSIFPPIPAEFRSYFQNCITNDFTGAAYFENYNLGGYEDMANAYILPSVTDPERAKIITNFAKAADKVPNFENILYSLDYYHKTGKISNVTLETFENKIKNDLRKVNIKLRLFASRYQEAASLLSSKESQIDFYSRNIVSEELAMRDIIQLMVDENITEGDERWGAYTNQINAARENIFEYHQKLLDLYSINYNLNDKYVVTNMANVGGSTEFTCVNHALQIGDEISLIRSSTIDPIPADFSFKDFYYVVAKEANTFRISLTEGGTAIELPGEDLTKLTGWYFIKDIVIDGLEVESHGGKYRFKKDSYTWLRLNVYGYYNSYLNAINQKLDELRELIIELDNKKTENLARIAELDAIINNINNEENPLSIEAQVERDGKQAQVDASLFEIGDYLTDVFDPIIKGMYQHQYEYVQMIANYLANYTYNNTLIDYTTWKPTIVPVTSFGTWGQIAGVVVGALEANKDGVNDIMMRLGNTGAATNTVQVQTISLTAAQSYRVAATLKVPAGSFGTFTAQLYKNGTPIASSISFTLTTLGDPRWIVFNHNFSATGSSAKLFPAESTVTISSSTAAIATTAADYQVRFTWNGTNQVYLYRPRVERISALIPTLADMYYLYDNPLSVNYAPSVSIGISYIEGLYDLLYNESYPGNVTVAKQEIINYLYKNYEQYLIEGYYDNSEEVSSEGLMEQALLAFASSKYPKITYGISVIDVSALDNYKYLNLNVNDKILISETSDRLYKAYQTEDTKYLNIKEISYDLRNPGSTSLTVAQDDETKKILQYILKGVY